jgi:hypothetical protein
MKKLIKYGDYECSQWNGIISLDDPLFNAWWNKVKQYLDGYEFWIYGSVIEEGVLAKDIDASIIGPNNPSHINWMLDNIVRVSFEYGLFPDIKYSIDGKLFKWSEYKATRESVLCKYAYYKPNMFINNKGIYWGTKENDLWVAERLWPMLKAVRSNHNYKDPVKLFG